MSIIDHIKRFLGVGDNDRGVDADTGGAVTIERERSDADPAAETEAAVKGTDTGAVVDDTTGIDSPETESTATDTEPRGAVDADTKTDTTTETEMAPTEGDDEITTDATTEAGGEAAPDATTEADDETPPDTTTEVDDRATSVEEVRGIGPAYADRLAAADIETVAELAAADAEQVASAADLSPKRLRTWIGRAGDDDSA